jgi:hypothetical protein
MLPKNVYLTAITDYSLQEKEPEPIKKEKNLALPSSSTIDDFIGPSDDTPKEQMFITQAPYKAEYLFLPITKPEIYEKDKKVFDVGKYELGEHIFGVCNRYSGVILLNKDLMPSNGIGWDWIEYHEKRHRLDPSSEVVVRKQTNTEDIGGMVAQVKYSP